MRCPTLVLRNEKLGVRSHQSQHPYQPDLATLMEHHPWRARSQYNMYSFHLLSALNLSHNPENKQDSLPRDNFSRYMHKLTLMRDQRPVEVLLCRWRSENRLLQLQEITRQKPSSMLLAMVHRAPSGGPSSSRAA